MARLGSGSVDLILTSPPYGRDIQLIDKPAWIRGGSLGAKDARNYSGDPGNLGHARGEPYRAAMAEVYAACAAALKPGGFLVVVTKNLRARRRPARPRRHHRRALPARRVFSTGST